MNTDCRLYTETVEHYYPRSDSPMAPCEACGCVTFKLISGFQIAFSGEITRRYLDREAEGAHKPDGGHWVWEKRNAPDGKPRAVLPLLKPEDRALFAKLQEENDGRLIIASPKA